MIYEKKVYAEIVNNSSNISKTTLWRWAIINLERNSVNQTLIFCLDTVIMNQLLVKGTKLSTQAISYPTVYNYGTNSQNYWFNHEREMSRDRIDSLRKIVFVPSRRVRLDKQKLTIPEHKIILKSDDLWKESLCRNCQRADSHLN
jgi:hypothetical protein